MFSSQHAQTAGPKVYEEGAFQRVTVNLSGRLMLANHEEFPCAAVDMSPGDVVLHSSARPRPGERIIAYVDHVGRLEGTVARLADQQFVVQLNATERKREKLAAQLTWIANRHELGLPEDRRHDRLTPRRTRTTLTLESGAVQHCRLIDLSLSGAAIDTELRLPVGTPVTLGAMRGRVVRLFQEGLAIEFVGVQTLETLREFL
ncbi:pilus assembly protein PilZ [Rhizobium rhizosphaerae]|uniref:Pilus assembly protein PilZ n=1 Tax=Xaviernesmea rhizosphaerae TaxID=1672749 RepID=A0A1Q9AJB4_9HYPH|nr:PilZ domain-containing protein [Xaviernesmea rhizosphaerae]OLP55353.1 pilus assembly protein PilZ [Xaviernesmea rhizosphaerae]OQP87948.1 pilus assembly protein PilZ [Xaviernesmea rhizosphaerae]